MAKLIDLTNKRFGKLVVIRRYYNPKNTRPMWLCKCDCGNEKVVKGGALRDGLTVSCGCFGKEQRKKVCLYTARQTQDFSMFGKTLKEDAIQKAIRHTSITVLAA